LDAAQTDSLPNRALQRIPQTGGYRRCLTLDCQYGENQMKRMLWLAIVVSVLCGCSIKMVSYSPSLLMNGSGVIYARDFKYMPFEEGKLKSNEVDTGSGLNPVYSEMDIKDYVADALLKELKFIGYKLDPSSSTIISGDILEYSCDYVGFTKVTIKVRINFRVMKLVDGNWNNVYTKNHEGFYQANKLVSMEYSLLINEGLRNCIKNFIENAQSARIL
jgi:hypothetical protein